MTFVRWSMAGLAATSLVALSIGCNRGGTPTSSLDPGPMGQMGPMAGGQAIDESGPHAAGKKVFNANCARCHTVSASGGGMPGGPPQGPGGPRGPGGGGPRMGGGRGPNLAKVGQDPVHTVQWLMEYVRDPKSKKENARMQGFDESRLGNSDLKALAEFLATLKG